MSIPTARFGDGLEVSVQGFGGMALTSVYGAADPADSLATLHAAVDAGVTHLDTANVYGNGANEELLAKLLKERRDEAVVATKFGILPFGSVEQFAPRSRGDRLYVRESAEASLRRLGVDQIDLYYLHRVDPDTPIEETVSAMAELVAQGKVRHLGLSEVTAAELRRAQAVHPIAAVESEWSVWSRDVEDLVLPACAELNVGFVPYSPLGRGFLTGALTNPDAVPGAQFLRSIPRFSEANLAANLAVAGLLQSIAAELGHTPAQVALAWLYAKAEEFAVAISPIPGTRRAARIKENVAAVGIALPSAIMEQLDGLAERTVGERSDPSSSWVSSDRERGGTH